jgi:ferritin
MPMSEEDFNPDQTIKRIDRTLNQPDKFAELFCNAAKTQRIIDAALKEIVSELIKKDSDTKEHLKSLVREVEKEDFRAFLRKVGFAGWTLLVAAFSATVVFFIKG